MKIEKSRNQNINNLRWKNFKQNKRAFWSLILFSFFFILSLFAELIANDKPLLVKYQGTLYIPIFSFYSEETFGGDLKTEAIYSDKEIECLIVTGGLKECWDTPEILITDAKDGMIKNRKSKKASLSGHLFPIIIPQWTHLMCQPPLLLITNIYWVQMTQQEMYLPVLSMVLGFPFYLQ